MSPSSKMFGQPKQARATSTVSQKLLIISLLLAFCAPSEASRTQLRERRSIGANEDFYGGEEPDAAARAARPLALTAAASSATSAAGGGEKPRLIPLVASDSGYSENSSVNILCTVSQGHHETLTFDWFKDGQQLGSGSSAAAEADSTALAGPQIESQPDHSLLRISRVKSQHAGRYTCSAKNQFGQDASSVNLAVNGNYRGILLANRARALARREK